MASEEHIQLANVIKNLHSNLREQVAGGGDDYKVWKDHLSNKKLLNQYSKSMFKLATQHWESTEVLSETSEDAELGEPRATKNPSRIDWVVKHVKHYYSTEGSASSSTSPLAAASRIKLRSKDRKRLDRHKTECENIPGKAGPCPACRLVEQEAVPISPAPPIAAENRADVGSSVRLLDVGSCYNPFSAFEGLDVLAIDIAPAAGTSVMKADLLSIEIGDEDVIEPPETSQQSSLPSVGDDGGKGSEPAIDSCGRVTQLARDSFQAVVFCFLLEYLPTPQLRLDCCRRAEELLAEDGILVIVTPDSCRQGRNFEQFRSWDLGLRALGFSRVTYEKTSHFHGLSYRKLSKVQRVLYQLDQRARKETDQSAIRKTGQSQYSKGKMREIPEDISSLFFIPQDFKSGRKSS